MSREMLSVDMVVVGGKDAKRSGFSPLTTPYYKGERDMLVAELSRLAEKGMATKVVRAADGGLEIWVGGAQRQATDILTTTQVADLLGVSSEHVRNLITLGILKAKNVAAPGRRPSFRIARRDVHSFQQHCEAEVCA